MKEQIHEHVKAGYGAIASLKQSSKQTAPSCCGGVASATQVSGRDYAQSLGYSAEELDQIPEEANLGLSCGNPSAMAALSPGEVVVDLGSGGGMDAFLAASRVGDTGRVIGVDMTPEMLRLSRETAENRGVDHYVEFREGFIEDLPVESDSVDVVLSNCVINLSPDKKAVFNEAFRVLKPGGRLAVSDICLTSPLPEVVTQIAGSYVACIAGAALADEYLDALRGAGFSDVRWTRSSADSMIDFVTSDPMFSTLISDVDDTIVDSVRGTIWSYKIEARKPWPPQS